MKIGIDMDGVLCDFTNAARLLMVCLFGKPTPDKIQTSWNFESLGLTPHEEKRLWKHIDLTPNWWEDSIKRLPSTNLLELADKNHDLFFITNRKPSTGHSIVHQTKLWLVMNTGLFIPTVIVTKQKGRLAETLGLNYFIDDKPENCQDVYSNSPNTKVYIQDATYNQGALPHISRANSLNHFLAEIGAV